MLQTRRNPLVLLLVAVLSAVLVDSTQARALRGGGAHLAACSCISIYDPVCVRNGTEVATNAACALCDDALRGVSYRKEWCAKAPTKEETQTPKAPSSGQGTVEWEVVVEEEEEPAGEEEEFCACAAVYDPVCARNGTVLASNEGCALCDASLKGVEYSGKWCGIAGGEGGVTGEVSKPPVEDDACMCTMQYDPVCARNGTVVASNAGCARCDASLKGVDYSTAWCNFASGGGDRPAARPPVGSSDAPKVEQPRGGSTVNDCVCPAVFKPVCDESGKQVASNACRARCTSGLDASEYSEEWCPWHKAFVPLVVPNPEDPPTPAPSTAESKAEAAAATPAPSTSANKPSTVGGDQICICPMNYHPYCREDGVEVAANQCEVACYGLDPTAVSNENCFESRGRRLQEPKEECLARCPPGEPQVCDLLGRGLGTACQAACKQGSREGVFSEEYCESEGASPPLSATSSVPPEVKANNDEAPTKICICPLVFSPVCTSDGVEVGDNSCDAECRGHSPDTFSGSYCGRDVYESHNALPPESVGDKPAEQQNGWFDTPCTCPDSDFPVCANDGSVVASSACDAECSGLKRGVDFLRAWCTSGVSHEEDDEEGDTAATDARSQSDANTDGIVYGSEAFGDCQCPDVYSPVCLENGKYVAASACYARCYRLAEGKALQPCPLAS